MKYYALELSASYCIIGKKEEKKKKKRRRKKLKKLKINQLKKKYPISL